MWPQSLLCSSLTWQLLQAQASCWQHGTWQAAGDAHHLWYAAGARIQQESRGGGLTLLPGAQMWTAPSSAL